MSPTLGKKTLKVHREDKYESMGEKPPERTCSTGMQVSKNENTKNKAANEFNENKSNFLDSSKEKSMAT